ncbi:MAG TPA: gluconate 2-dehydrogenase subunit 3 family protein [Humisphaera sp.]
MSNEPNSLPTVPLTVDGNRPAGGTISRRQAMQWVLGAVAASSLPTPTGLTLGQEVGRTTPPQEQAAKVPPRVPGHVEGGYGTDPVLNKEYKPGDVWPLTFDAKQRRAAKALADTIMPKDAYGPAASEVGVVEMIDEWVSAPYQQQQADRPVVLEGLAWVDAEAAKRFGGKAFADVTDEQRRAICDDVCHAPAAKPEFRQAARFFGRFRSLTAGAYYATPAGWKAIGYVGNVALPQFDGPPAEVLAKLGVTQTVK